MGKVVSITDYGAFIDLGGIDGLLHITDMSWGRVNHPSEVVNIGDKLMVKVLNFDLERERSRKILLEQTWSQRGRAGQAQQAEAGRDSRTVAAHEAVVEEAEVGLRLGETGAVGVPAVVLFGRVRLPALVNREIRVAPRIGVAVFRFEIGDDLRVVALFQPEVVVCPDVAEFLELDFEEDADLIALSVTLTCQMPRAWEIADRYRAEGKPVVFGGIATSTAPAATIDVIHEVRGRGSFTDTLLGVVAIALAVWTVVAWGVVDFSFGLSWAVLGVAIAAGGVIGYRSLRISGIEPGGRLGLYGFGASALSSQSEPTFVAGRGGGGVWSILVVPQGIPVLS